MKRNILSSFLVITLLSFLIGGATMAYFTDEFDLKPTDDFKMGDVEIEVTSPKGSRDFTVQCDHGEQYEREWKIKNKGSLPVSLRVTLTDENGLALREDVKWKVTSKEWARGDDDYWYYTKPVKSHKSVKVGFSIQEDEGNNLELAGHHKPTQPSVGGGEALDISLKMQAEAIQSEHVKDYKIWPKTELDD